MSIDWGMGVDRVKVVFPGLDPSSGVLGDAYFEVDPILY